MSLNNVLPMWLLLLDVKEKQLSRQEFREWLLTEEAEKELPKAVRINLIREYRKDVVI